jgi:Flp pilus assembly pilin Flp
MFKNFLKDEKGAITTVEIMGYTVLIGGMAALVGFGLTGLARGKTNDFVKDIKNLEAVNKPIDANGDSTYTIKQATGSTSETGIMTKGDATN